MPQTTVTDVDQIVQRYAAVWSEPDTAARRRTVAELWAPDGVEFVEGARFRGHDGLVDRVSEAYGLFVASGEYHVTDDNHVTVHDDVVMFTIRLTYAKGPQADEVAWAARVFLVLGDGRIVQDYHLTVQPLPEAQGLPYSSCRFSAGLPGRVRADHQSSLSSGTTSWSPTPISDRLVHEHPRPAVTVELRSPHRSVIAAAGS
ncbi:nuclear transport factor 2 family protein [Streptomyces sp. NPDC020362]|uniref:nuclear transport factor 2 family protein n=1 Tax=unclassified Streptomyces TaxID=2593676 RepID=UPI000A48949E